MKTAAEHLAWCKERAMEYVNAGDNTQAFASMCSDIGKHPETAARHQSTNQLGMSMLMAGHLGTKQQMTDWIQGYN